MGRSRLTIIPKASASRMLSDAGAHRVSDAAAEFLVGMLERKGKAITTAAMRAALHAGRKTVKAADVKLAAGDYSNSH